MAHPAFHFPSNSQQSSKTFLLNARNGSISTLPWTCKCHGFTGPMQYHSSVVTWLTVRRQTLRIAQHLISLKIQNRPDLTKFLTLSTSTVTQCGTLVTYILPPAINYNTGQSPINHNTVRPCIGHTFSLMVSNTEFIVHFPTHFLADCRLKWRPTPNQIAMLVVIVPWLRDT